MQDEYKIIVLMYHCDL